MKLRSLLVVCAIAGFSGHLCAGGYNSLQILDSSPDVPAQLAFGQKLTFRVSYTATPVGGVKIFVRPYTSGVPTRGADAHPVEFRRAGSGEITAWFSFNGAADVGEVRVSMVDATTNLHVTTLMHRIQASWRPGVAPPVAGDRLTIRSVTPPSPAALRFGNRMTVRVKYRLTSANSAQIFVRPYTSGSPTPGVSAHPSGAYSRGSGEMEGWFTFNRLALVDEVRVEMVRAGTNTVLAGASMPVRARWRLGIGPPVRGDDLTIESLAPPSPAVLRFGNRMSVKVKYRLASADSAQIFVRPYTAGSPTPGVSAHPSGAYSRGSGEMEGWFTFNRLALVDEIRVEMVRAGTNTVLARASKSIEARWRPGIRPPGRFDKLTIDSVTPPSPANLRFGNRMTVKVKYRLTTANSAQIFVRPYTAGSPTPGASAHPSGAYSRGSGEMEGWFTFNRMAVVDEIRVEMVRAGTNTVLARTSQAIEAKWRPAIGPPVRVDKLTIESVTPPGPATLIRGRKMVVKVKYRVGTVASARIFVRPYLGGVPAPGHAAHPSGAYSRGPGDMEGWFSFHRPALIDEIRVTMVDVATGRTLAMETRRISAQWR